MDISGSMCLNICSRETKAKPNSSEQTRLDLSKQAIFTLLAKLESTDNVCITSFESKSYLIQPLCSVEKIKKDETFKENINKLQTGGGTNLYLDLKGAYEALITNAQIQSNNKNKRIIFITDMDSFNDKEFINLYRM